MPFDDEIDLKLKQDIECLTRSLDRWKDTSMPAYKRTIKEKTRKEEELRRRREMRAVPVPVANKLTLGVAEGTKSESDLWLDFGKKFELLANEEQAISNEKSEDQSIRAHFDYNEYRQAMTEQGDVSLLDNPESRQWLISDGPNENFRARFQALVTRAGVALGSPTGVEALGFWLHRLFLDLRENKSKELFAASGKGGIILHVCTASVTFCARLERQALEQFEAGNMLDQHHDTEADRLRTGGKQPESSDVENNEKTTGGFSPSQDYRSVSIHSKNFTLTSRQAQVIQILDESRKGGHPDVGQDYILEQLGSPNSRLSDTFKSNRDAWKALVISGKKKGTKRLIE